MPRHLRPLLLLGAVALFFGGSASELLAQETPIADIKSFPQRFVNRQVTVQGQVTDVVVNREGLSQGTYRILDDSDPQGILIRTNAELPVPGRIYVIVGTVAQLPQNAAQVGIVEESRSGEGPSWLLAVVLLSAVSAIVLAVLLVRTLRQPAAAPAPMPAPAAFVPPAAAPFGGAPFAAPPPREPTQPFTPPRAVTVPFEVSGASLSVVEGSEKGKEVPIGVPEFLIGRPGGRSNHFAINDATVSQSHARVRWDRAADRFFLVNESQTNKVRLDGSATEMAELVPGSKIQLGAVTLEFRRNGTNGANGAS